MHLPSVLAFGLLHLVSPASARAESYSSDFSGLFGKDVTTFKPVENIEQLRRTNSLNIVEGRNEDTPNLAKRYVDTLRRYNLEVPKHVVKRAQRTGTVQATSWDNEESWYAEATVGQQKFRMNFDTASSDTWVMGKNADTGHSFSHRKYNGTGTQTWSTFLIKYGDNSTVQGTVYADTVAIGGTNPVGVAFGVADVVSPFWHETKWDGVVGMTPNNILSQCRPAACRNWMQKMYDNSLLPQYVFTTTFRHNGVGTLDLGFVDFAKYDGPLDLIPASTAGGHWLIKAAKYRVGKQKKSTNLNIDVVVDTGSTETYLPKSVVDAYFKSVKSAKFNEEQRAYLFPCNATLPDLSIEFTTSTKKTHRATVSGQIISMPYRGNTCWGGLRPVDIDVSILGLTFLKSQYAVFDFAAPGVWLGQQAGLSS